MHKSTSSRRPNIGRTPLIACLVAGVIAAGGLALTGTGVYGSPAAPAGSDISVATSRAAGRWQQTPVPVAKGDLTAVAALSGTQAWAVGYRLTSATEPEALALRWNGTAWARESTLPSDTFPQALAVRSPRDIWAVGTTAAHWDGRSWTTRNLDRDPAGPVLPDAVATTSDGKVWAAGRAVQESAKNAVPAIQTWDGSAWRRQVLPKVGKGELTGLAALAPDDIWAVGGATSGGVERPYAAHWDGTKWTDATTPDIADGRLRAVGRSGDGTLWAVGGKGAVSVALRWDSRRHCWEKTADPRVVVRGFSTVPHSADLWTVGIAKRGDLVPTVTRFTGRKG